MVWGGMPVSWKLQSDEQVWDSVSDESEGAVGERGSHCFGQVLCAKGSPESAASEGRFIAG